MKRIPLLLVASLLISSGISLSAPARIPMTGNWKGTLEVGQVKLRLVFKISQAPGGGLSGKLDSLDQGARDLEIDTVTVKDNTVRMEVKSIQGVYEGTLSGTKLTGQWKQGAQSLPLTLERSQGRAAGSDTESLSPADLAASKLAAQKVAGEWNGTLAAGAANLRLRVKITKTSSGAAAGTLESLDQGAQEIPLSAITIKEGKLHFEARGIGGIYEGTLATDSAALTGEWRQGGQSLPLDFKKAAPAK